MKPTCGTYDHIREMGKDFQLRSEVRTTINVCSIIANFYRLGYLNSEKTGWGGDML